METGVGTARPRAPRLARERSDTEAARARGAWPVMTGARARLDRQAGMRERDGDRFRPRTNPRGQATVRSLRATAHFFIRPVLRYGTHAADAWGTAGSAASRSSRSMPLITRNMSGMKAASSIAGDARDDAAVRHVLAARQRDLQHRAAGLAYRVLVGREHPALDQPASKRLAAVPSSRSFGDG